MKKRLLLLALVLACACGKGGPSIKSFTADKDNINENDPVTLAWVVSSADRVTIDHDVGLETGNSTVVNPLATTTYALTAGSATGSATAQVTVVVATHLQPVVIKSFTASATQVQPGAAVTLSWNITGTVASLSVGGASVPPSATSLVVNPAATTRYTLTAAGVVGKQPSAPSILIRVAPTPAIRSFSATPAAVSQGEPVLLRWSAVGAMSYALSDDHGLALALGLSTSKTVRPVQSTTYTLKAHGPTGDSTQTTTVNVALLSATMLTFTPSAVGSAAVQLVADACANPCTTLTLRLVATQDFSASALALNLPLDGEKVSLHSLSDAAAPGFSINTMVFNLGTNPPAQAIALPAAGPLASVLTLGFAQKPSGSGVAPVDAQVHATDTLCTLRLDLVPSGGRGVIFPQAGGQAALPKALVRGATFSSTSFALGTLTAN